MTNRDRLSEELEQRFGLRNTRLDWIRRQTAFSPEELKDVICRTDICAMSHGTFPWDVHRAHAVTLGVPALVQVEDVINVAQTEPRSADRPRMLQVTLSDGGVDIVAVEAEAWGARLSLNTVLGTKIILRASARVRRGRLVLSIADFDVLGAPPSNIWGVSYDSEIASTRTAAGLPDVRTASLARVLDGDDPRHANLVWTGGAPDALPLNIGGLADPALLQDDENGGDSSAFSTLATLPTSLVGARDSMVPAPRTSEIQPIVVSGGTISGNAPAPLPYTTAATSEPQNNTVITIPPSDDGGEVVDLVNMDSGMNTSGVVDEIPDIPDCASDGDDDIMAKYLDSQDGLREPTLPISRLVDITTDRTRDSNENSIAVVRAFSPKAERSMLPGVNLKTIIAPLDDGTAVCTARFATPFIRTLSTLHGNTDREATIDVDADAARLRVAVRGLCGFFSVETPPDTDGRPIITGVSPMPPDMDPTELLRRFADNIEARLVSFVITGG